MSYKQFDEAERQTLEQIMRLRRDVRGNRFIDRELDDEHVQRIIRAGMMAPSVGYSQPWRFVIIKDAATKSAVARIFAEENQKAAHLFEGSQQATYQQLKLEGITEAPVNLAVFYEPRNTPVLGQTSMLEAGQYSTVCAIQNMWLMARSLNIGLGWVSILDAPQVEALLGARHHKLIAYLCIGHVDTFYDKPELETLGWECKKHYQDVVYEESLEASIKTD
ncbi:MAG: 5,6-dimethylbenzimidazole synthase [Hahellaceae bacterium]|nr:5,6-dimethylbenzimidazole synthase [Hahellaceae bacterium]